MKQNFDLPPEGGEELAALLERSGVDFTQEGETFRFRFASGGCVWQTVCCCRESRVLVYGIHPTPVTDPVGALALCGEINSRVVEGSLFLTEERFVFRTGVRLTERFEAQARIAAALKTNYYISILSQHICNFALTFIAPAGTDYCFNH